jgi:hypothetical protein
LISHLTGKNELGSVKLEGELNNIDNISGHWPATMPHNPQHLHIIVELPPGMHCVHSSWVSRQRDFTDHVSIVLNLLSHFTTSLLAALLTMSSSFIATYHALLL